MIESSYTPLRPYTTLKSPEIKTTWNGERYLISRVILIAWKVFSQNITTFFYNRYAQLKNLVTWSKPIAPAAAPAAPAAPAPPEPATSPPVSYSHLPTWKHKPPLIEKLASYTPYLATCAPILGSLAGIIYRRAMQIPDYEKFCNPRDIVFPLINSFKHSELKTFALLSATIAASPLIYRAIQNVRGYRLEGVSLWKKISFQASHYFQMNFQSKGELATYLSIAALSLSNPLYAQLLGLKGGSFNSSGHVMLKISLGVIIAKVFEATTGKYSYPKFPKFTIAMATAYAFTDFTFLANTAAFCHTPSESFAGMFWGLGVVGASVGIGYLTDKSFDWINNRKVS
ncbi:MAG: hypothetical protein K1000chlam2_00605 [Chlamydiae bacterium]|nr:hypothetical protein [Chlamydiota bacterium]